MLNYRLNSVKQSGIGGEEGIMSAIFWDITQRMVLIPYRRFGTTYRSNHGP